METKTGNEEIILKPVGYVKSDIKAPSLKAGKDDIELDKSLEKAAMESKYIKSLKSELLINSEYEGILEGLDDFSHAIVLYWPHLQPAHGRTFKKVHPIGRKEFPLVGIFSTCSPARPNPVLVTVVRIIGIKGNSLFVQGLEAIDGSPVIDIKPFTRTYCSAEDVKLADWMERIENALSDV
jgi:tRNA-Thr(GGU) m(6)t(6)A37 methyltransferase TsaA